MNEKAQLVSLRRLWIVTWLCGSCCVVFDLRRLVTGLGIGFSGTRFVLTDPNEYGFQHTLAMARAEEVSEALELLWAYWPMALRT